MKRRIKSFSAFVSDALCGFSFACASCQRASPMARAFRGSDTWPIAGLLVQHYHLLARTSIRCVSTIPVRWIRGLHVCASHPMSIRFQGGYPLCSAELIFYHAASSPAAEVWPGQNLQKPLGAAGNCRRLPFREALPPSGLFPLVVPGKARRTARGRSKGVIRSRPRHTPGLSRHTKRVSTPLNRTLFGNSFSFQPALTGWKEKLFSAIFIPEENRMSIIPCQKLFVMLLQGVSLQEIVDHLKTCPRCQPLAKLLKQTLEESLPPSGKK